MSKQTAVEWLVEQVFGKHTYVWNDVIEKAKEMEREQIEDAWHAGVSDSDLAMYYFNDHYRATSEKYYNKTYKGGEQ